MSITFLEVGIAIKILIPRYSPNVKILEGTMRDVTYRYQNVTIIVIIPES